MAAVIGLCGVSTRPVDELGAWLALCETLGIRVEDQGLGHYVLLVPPGVTIPTLPGQQP